MQFMVDNAYRTFESSVLSTETKVLLVGAFTDEATAVKSYLKRRRPDIDLRRKLSVEDEDYVSRVERYAASAKIYIDWVRAEGGNPIWKEAVVSYCTAFENCLKSIAVAFHLANTSNSSDLMVEVYVPSGELRNAIERITTDWNSRRLGIKKSKAFFDEFIFGVRPPNVYQSLLNHSVDEFWEIAVAANRVRNDIVHNLARMSTQEQLGSLLLHPNWPIELTEGSVAVVGNAFCRIMKPFDPYPGELGL